VEEQLSVASTEGFWAASSLIPAAAAGHVHVWAYLLTSRCITYLNQGRAAGHDQQHRSSHNGSAPSPTRAVAKTHLL